MQSTIARDIISVAWVGPSVAPHLAGLFSRKDLRLIGRAADYTTAISLLRATHPHVVLVDASAFGDDAPALISALHRAQARCAILVLDERLDSAWAERLLRLGARGLARGNATTHSLLKAIHTLHTGHISFPPSLMGLLLERFLGRLQSEADFEQPLSAQLTQREHDIINYTRQGMTNKQIARRLGISDKTVKTHLQRVYKKLHISRRGELGRR